MIISKGGIKYSIEDDSVVRGEGFEHESLDCFVRAVKHATGVPYRDAHAHVAQHFNRIDRKGTHNPQNQLSLVAVVKGTIFGYRVFDKSPSATLSNPRNFRSRPRFIYPTLASQIAKFKSGRFLLCSRHHAWAIIDGVVHDSRGTTSSRTQVVIVYELKASSQCEKEGI